MKKLYFKDGSIIESEIGYNPETGWAIPLNVTKVEFEDGTKFVLAE